MSALKVTQIKAKLLSLFEPYLDVSDLSPRDAQRGQKILSRCLAAFAVYSLTGCDPKEAAESVWDGSDDNGIDAAYFDATNDRVILVQSKWINNGAGEPEANELAPFLKGVKDAIEQYQENFAARLQGRLADIFVPLNTPGTAVHLVLITTGANSLSRHGQALIDRCLKEINGDDDPDAMASSEMIGLAEVYSSLANDATSGRLNLDAQILEWSRINDPYVAYFGLIDGLQLKLWWRKHGKRLVAVNIRHALGSTDVNKEIKETATSEPEKFWYFNNGITLVAQEAVKAPARAATQSAGQFTFRDASIVNGAQTVSSISTVDNDVNLGKLRVPIRVILLKSAPPGFGSEVTRTNNLQNKIQSRDFVTQDEEQRRLRHEMWIEGIDYNYFRSDGPGQTAKSCELIEVTTALACASGNPSLAVQVKASIGRLLKEWSKPPYKTIFNPSVSGAYAFNATTIQRMIDGWIKRKKKLAPRKSGHAWGILIHGNRLIAAAVFKKFGTQNLSKSIKEFQDNIDQVALDAVCEETYKKMVATLNRDYAGKFLPVIFKNVSDSQKIFDAAI